MRERCRGIYSGYTKRKSVKYGVDALQLYAIICHQYCPIAGRRPGYLAGIRMQTASRGSQLTAHRSPGAELETLTVGSTLAPRRGYRTRVDRTGYRTAHVACDRTERRGWARPTDDASHTGTQRLGRGTDRSRYSDGYSCKAVHGVCG